MRRRELITLLGGAAVAWPVTVWAQQGGRQATIGLMGSDTAAGQSRWTAAFVRRLGELGWIEGHNLVIEYRWAEGHNERLFGIADELVRLNVNVIVTHNTPPSLAAKRATSAIPIVFATAGDPVGTGIIFSLAEPGGNITGLSSQSPDTAGKRLELLREFIPHLRQLAILSDVDNPFTALDIAEIQRAARAFNIGTAAVEAREAEDIAPAFAAFQGRVEALYVPANPLMFANRIRVNTLALAGRLPTMHNVREYVETGGLVSYGPNWSDMWRRAADFVDKILRGANPGQIPVEQPTKFDLVINLKTAKALGVEIPGTLLARADEVIE
jgi:putative ABC transport system substrate-binding protein